MKNRKYRLSPEQQTVMGEVLRGGALSLEYIDGEEHFSIVGGRSVNPRSARRLIQHGYLEPVGDGLFGNTQTYQPKKPDACGLCWSTKRPIGFARH